ncbi:hypothetical protein BN997_02842 [Oceanobacillus oncorhynchi]|uniref:Uncharacterized protein n=1 Tax=Oceanobacillus oncorhynchi TaxID=545501 RepID=A0A0A1MIQ1_9BACI|nr:hypothetical protein [Oceanobacillus oncorhynchi]CEI82953.1 hypothetical protein BN997_02842 [Oceanobacillus oncorhynchi]
MNVTTFIWLLDDNVKAEIEKDLRATGISEEDVQRGLDSRLCDLEDTIDIQKYEEMLENS